jgi:DNA-binding transcriptional LysR family regulator
MNIKDLDLNLLRLFDAVWRTRSVSLAAQQLGMSQPAASQGLARLRAVLGDALFERSGSGVRSTPRADRLAQAVQLALATLEDALNVSQVFDPLRSKRVLRVHLSDIGEARFLPELVLALQRMAPNMRLEAVPLPHHQIGPALDNGQLDLAIGFLPEVTDTLHRPLLRPTSRSTPSTSASPSSPAFMAAMQLSSSRCRRSGGTNRRCTNSA